MCFFAIGPNKNMVHHSLWSGGSR